MNQKKTLLGLALVACLAGMSHAAGGVDTVASKAPHPKDTAGSVEGLTYQGIKTERIPAGNPTGQGQLLHNGPAFVDEVCLELGTQGTYSILYDETDVSALSTALLSGVTSSAALAYSMTPLVFSAGAYSNGLAANNGNWTGMNGCYVPIAPIKFIGGVYGQSNVTGSETIVHGHCTDGSNPCAF